MVRPLFNTVLVLLVPVLVLDLVTLLLPQITFATCFGCLQFLSTT